MLDESFSWFQGVGVREFDAQGEVTAIIWSLNDITALKQAELDLNTSDRKFASVAATAPVGIFQTDTEHNCVYVNDRMAEFTGRSREQMLGKGYMESIHPDDRQRLMAHAEAFSKDKTRTVNNPFEVRHLLPDGRITWVLGHVAKEFDDNGNPIGFVGTLTDITNAKVAEERQQRLNDRLQESESKFKLLVEQVADLIWSADIELKFTYLSPKFQSLFGLDPDDWIGKTCFELVHPDDLEIMIAKGESLREDPKTPISLEFRHLCKRNRASGRSVPNATHD